MITCGRQMRNHLPFTSSGRLKLRFPQTSALTAHRSVSCLRPPIQKRLFPQNAAFSAQRNVSYLTPLGAAFNTRPSSKLNMMGEKYSFNEKVTGLFGFPGNT